MASAAFGVKADIHVMQPINNIIHRSLAAAKIPSRLEPVVLQRSDGKHPDGITASAGYWYGMPPVRIPLHHHMKLWQLVKWLYMQSE